MRPWSSGLSIGAPASSSAADGPGGSSAPDGLVQMAGRCSGAMRAEHLDHLRVGEVERAAEVVVDEVLARAGVDHEHRAGRIGVLAGVVEHLVAEVAVPLVGRVGARLEQYPREFRVAGDPGGAVEGDLEPLLVVDEVRVRISPGLEQQSRRPPGSPWPVRGRRAAAAKSRHRAAAATRTGRSAHSRLQGAR